MKYRTKEAGIRPVGENEMVRCRSLSVQKREDHAAAATFAGTKERAAGMLAEMKREIRGGNGANAL